MKKLFIDELISAPKVNGMNGETRNQLKQSHVFLVQNILPTIPDKIYFSQLPRLVPPYENCWFEWTSNVKKRDDAPDDFSGELDERLLDIMLNPEGDARAGVKLTSQHNNGGGWSIYLQFFMRMGNNPPLMLPIAYAVKLNADGFLINTEKLIQEGLPQIFNELASQMLTDNKTQGSINTVLYALGLLNCKNIVTIERGGPPAGVERNRHRVWTHRHYVLQIRPLREIKKIEHDGESLAREVSFHFCRGHFKIYTAEKPLFGKYVGTFWWDAHARGSIKTGIVTKDYNVNPPENT